MNHFKAILSSSIVFLASALGACSTQIEGGEPAGYVTEGALEQGNGNPECLYGIVERNSCVDPGELKLEAYGICVQNGLELTGLQYEGICNGWQTDEAQYECCPALPAQPPPPPGDPSGEPPPAQELSICSSSTLGDGQTCQDLGNFKLLAHEACNGAGLELVDISVADYGTSCNSSEGLLVDYKCGTYSGVCP